MYIYKKVHHYTLCSIHLTSVTLQIHREVGRLHWRPKVNQSPLSYLRRDLSLNLSSDSARLGFPTSVFPPSTIPHSHPVTRAPEVTGMGCHDQLYGDAGGLNIGSHISTENTYPTEPSAQPLQRSVSSRFYQKGTKDSETISWP